MGVPTAITYAGRFNGFHAVPASVSKTCPVRFDNGVVSYDRYSPASSPARSPASVAAACGRRCTPIPLKTDIRERTRSERTPRDPYELTRAVAPPPHNSGAECWSF
jgi:hypothetical protein